MWWVCFRRCSCGACWRVGVRTPLFPWGTPRRLFCGVQARERRERKVRPSQRAAVEPRGPSVCTQTAAVHTRVVCRKTRTYRGSSAHVRGKGSAGDCACANSPTAITATRLVRHHPSRRRAAPELRGRVCSTSPQVSRRCISLQPPLRAAAHHPRGEPTHPARSKRRKGGAAPTIARPQARADN